MSRVHDMGGRFGDGAVDPTDDATFAQGWHAKALALTLAAGGLGQWNIDTSRHAREQLSPKDYTRFSYYEKWMAGLADLLVAKGLVSEEELRRAKADGISTLSDKVLTADRVKQVLASGGPSERQVDIAAQFQVGDRVKTRNPALNINVAGGHTRLPGYAAGQVGKVVLCHGAHVLPDTNAHGLGENPEPLYAVAFAASDLWASERRSGGGDEVVLDLWQSYLEPA